MSRRVIPCRLGGRINDDFLSTSRAANKRPSGGMGEMRGRQLARQLASKLSPVKV